MGIHGTINSVTTELYCVVDIKHGVIGMKQNGPFCDSQTFCEQWLLVGDNNSHDSLEQGKSIQHLPARISNESGNVVWRKKGQSST